MANGNDWKKAYSFIKKYLAEGGDPDARDVYGETLLHLAAAEESSWPVRQLLSAGANVDLLDRDGQTPLHYAAGRSPSSVCLLIAAGSHVNARNHQGETPLSLAAAMHHLVIPILLKAGADPSIRDEMGRLPEDRVKELCGLHGIGKYDPGAAKTLRLAREVWELESVAGEGRDDRTGTRRRRI